MCTYRLIDRGQPDLLRGNGDFLPARRTLKHQPGPRFVNCERLAALVAVESNVHSLTSLAGRRPPPLKLSVFHVTHPLAFFFQTQNPISSGGFSKSRPNWWQY